MMRSLITKRSVISRSVKNAPELYEEIRTHNTKIEARLADWLIHVRLHADHMTFSDHPKLIKWRDQLAVLN